MSASHGIRVMVRVRIELELGSVVNLAFFGHSTSIYEYASP